MAPTAAAASANEAEQLGEAGGEAPTEDAEDDEVATSVVEEDEACKDLWPPPPDSDSDTSVVDENEACVDQPAPPAQLSACMAFYVDPAAVLSATFRGNPLDLKEWGSVKTWVFELPQDVQDDVPWTRGFFWAKGIYNGRPMYKHVSNDVILAAIVPEWKWVVAVEGKIIAWVICKVDAEHPPALGWRIPFLFGDKIVIGARWRPALPSELVEEPVQQRSSSSIGADPEALRDVVERDVVERPRRTALPSELTQKRSRDAVERPSTARGL